MRYLSTFSGIGGFELGIEQAYEALHNQPKTEGLRAEGDLPNADSDHVQRATCIGFSEIDKYATSIYQKHFPNHRNYGDITKINASELPDFELLVGGFPCQAFSIAGKRGGFDDTRGTMFFELARIIKEKRPRLCVFENVKGLLSHDKGRTFHTIIATLDELGYDCQWQVLNSKNYGVPQNRERVFIIGHLRGTPRPQVFPFGASNGNHIKEITSSVPQAQRVYDERGISPTLDVAAGGNRQPKIFVRETADGFHQARNDAKKSSIQGTHVTYQTGKVHALSTAHRPMTIEGLKIRRLTPIECERAQGFPDNWTEWGYVEREMGTGLFTGEARISDTQRYKTIGNAVTVNVIKEIFEHIL